MSNKDDLEGLEETAKIMEGFGVLGDGDLPVIKRVEEQKLTAARYKKLIDKIPVITFFAELGGKDIEIFVSESLETLFGYTSEEWIGDPILWYRVLHPDERERWSQELALSIMNGSDYISEYQIYSKQGELKWIKVEADFNKGEDNIVDYVQGVAYDITDLKNKQVELEVKNKELDQFVYVASHDLQEPLRQTTTLVSILKDELAGKLTQDQQDVLNGITRASERMRSLVSSILNFSKITTIKNSVELIDMTELTRKVLDVLDDKIKETKSKVVLNDLPQVRGNSSLIFQLLLNLISNSIKYSDPKRLPHIELSCHEEDDFWQFELKDNGTGIAPQYFDHIFEPFKRLVNKSDIEGTGIGLSTCKKVVNLHEGKIWIASKLGEGSQFYWTISKNL